MSKQRRQRRNRNKANRSRRNSIRKGVEQLESRVLPGGFLDLLAGAAIASHFDLLPEEQLVPEETQSESDVFKVRDRSAFSGFQTDLALPHVQPEADQRHVERTSSDATGLRGASDPSGTPNSLLSNSFVDSFYASNQLVDTSQHLAGSPSPSLPTSPSYRSSISQLGAGIGIGSRQIESVGGAELAQSSISSAPGVAPSAPNWMLGEGEGATSPTGPTSASGPTGPTAPSGPTGPTSPSDPTGPTSPTGPTGPTSPTGPTGPTSPTGPTGPTSPTGPTGPTSPTGPTGPTTCSGPSGPTGPSAPTHSASGPSAASGPTGPALPAAEGEAPAPAGYNEGQQVNFELGGAAGGAWTVDWGDGSSGAYATDVIASHTWVDDNATDSYDVTWTYTFPCRPALTYNQTITVNNVAPSPSGTISNPRQEGTEITVNGTATDPAGSNDTLTYSWEVFKGTATTAYASGGGSSLTFNPDDSGNFTVKLTVSDEDGGTATKIATIDVANLDPTAADASASTDADEDIVIDVLATATDPSSVDETILTVDDYMPSEENWGEVGIVDDPTVGSALKYWPGDFLKENLYLGHTVTDTFTYQAADDDGGQSANATVTVTTTGTEKHDRAVKWNVDVGLVAKINSKLDEAAAQVKGLANIAPNLAAQAFPNEASFLSWVQDTVDSLSPDIGATIEGLTTQLGDWATLTAEVLIDGVIAYLKSHVAAIADLLLPTFVGVVQDPILMGCNIIGSPVFDGLNPPSIGGTVTFSVEYGNPGGNYLGQEWMPENHNERSDEDDAIDEIYTAYVNAKVSVGMSIRILGNAVSVQVSTPVAPTVGVQLKCSRAVNIPIIPAP